MMGMAIGSIPVLPWVCQDDLAGGMVPVQEKEGLFSVATIFQDD